MAKKENDYVEVKMKDGKSVPVTPDGKEPKTKKEGFFKRAKRKVKTWTNDHPRTTKVIGGIAATAAVAGAFLLGYEAGGSGRDVNMLPDDEPDLLPDLSSDDTVDESVENFEEGGETESEPIEVSFEESTVDIE